VLRGGGDNGGPSAPSTTTPRLIVIRHGKPVGGIQKLTYHAGDRVRFTVRSDVADEVHVHGYNYMKDVTAGGQVSFDFPAKLQGDFEAELESRKEQIIDLRVLPG
jgi:hypothetical protein